MNRKILALILALAVAAAAIVLVVTLRDDKAETDPPKAGAEDPASTTPGVEDSIFDSDPVETQVPAESTAPDGAETITPVPENDIPITDVPDGTDVQRPDVPGTTQPAVTEPAATEPAQIPEEEIDYETFMAMDPALQRAYMESFESMDAFFAWYNAAKEAYELEHPSIDVGDGVIDLEDLVGQEP